MPRQDGPYGPSIDLGDSLTAKATGNGETLAVGSSSAPGTAAPDNTRAFRVSVTVDTWVEIGTAPTAAANTSFHQPAGTVEYYRAGPNDKVAVLQVSSAGSAYVRPVR